MSTVRGLAPPACENVASGTLILMPSHAYFDWNATAPLRPEAKAAVTAALEVTGNPSSIHAAGRATRRLVEEARDKVGALVGVTPREVVFTSGGTEANALALSPALGET